MTGSIGGISGLSGSSFISVFESLVQAFETILHQMAAAQQQAQQQEQGSTNKAMQTPELSTTPSVGGTQSAGSETAAGLSGYNTVPTRLNSASDASALVDKLSSQGIKNVRIQYSHDEINDPSQMAKLQAMVDQGKKDGVNVQFTYRDNDNGGGGNDPVGKGQMNQVLADEAKVINQFKGDSNFYLDTGNEMGQHTNDNWFQFQKSTISQAMQMGMSGDHIIAEDSEWGAGKSNGGSDSGLETYSKQLLAIDPDLVASIHVYNTGDGNAVASATKNSIEGLKSSGFKTVQLGEVGNAGWTGGDGFNYLAGIDQGMAQLKGYFAQNNIAVFPWMDQYLNGSISHTVGMTADGQINKPAA